MTQPMTQPDQTPETSAMTSPRADDEQAFIENYDANDYPPFAVTCDIVMLTIRNGALSVLLVERADQPFKGRWALPGGFVNIDEDIDDAAARELAEETGLEPARAHLEQLGTYGDPKRDPRMRVVSTAYLALLPEPGNPQAGSDAADARFWRVDEIEDDMLAFDHMRILSDGLERARAKLEYTALATKFTEREFTLGELQAVYEAVWGVSLHRPNFRRKVLSVADFVTPAGGTRDAATTGGRAATLYRAGDTQLLHPALLRPSRTVADDTKDAGENPSDDGNTVA